MKFKLNDRVSWSTSHLNDDRVSWSIVNLTGTVIDVLSNVAYIKWDHRKDTTGYNAFTCRDMEVITPKFKLNDRVSWSIVNLTGTVIDVLSDIVYINWDEGKHTIGYGAFVCRDMEVIPPVLLIGDRVALKKSSNKGVIISNYTPTLLVVQWDGSSEYFYISPKDLTLNNSIVANNDKLKVTLEVDITLNVKDELFNVAEKMVSILVKYKDYDSAKQLLECIELLNNLTNTK
jgi:hypothetical protein